MNMLDTHDEPIEPTAGDCRSSRLPYYLALAHFVACMTSMIGYVIPKLQDWAIIQTFILPADLPVSAPVYFLAWRYPIIALLWLIGAGTLWWYFLGRLVQRIFC